MSGSTAAARTAADRAGGDERPPVVIVDWNVTRASPIGTGILDLVEGLHSKYRFIVVAAHFENSHPDSVEHVRVRVPPGLAFVKELSWPSIVRLAFRRGRLVRERQALVRATQGQLPGSEIVDAHFCHRAYIQRYFHDSGTQGLRRISRSLVHRHGARLEEEAFRRARTICVSSVGLEREIAEMYPFAAEKLVHIPNPVDVSRFARPHDFDRDAARAGNGYARDDVVFLFVGLGDFARKGLAVAIRALARADADAARLLVVGGTESEIALFRRVAVEAGVDRRVRFVGFQNDVRPYLWQCDVFLFPTIYEAAPKVVDQAMAASLPVIVTPVNGIEERIDDGANGWLTERADDRVASKIQAAVDARPRLAEMGQAALATAQRLDSRFYIERWDRLLEKTLEARSATVG